MTTLEQNVILATKRHEATTLINKFVDNLRNKQKSTIETELKSKEDIIKQETILYRTNHTGIGFNDPSNIISNELNQTIPNNPINQLLTARDMITSRHKKPSREKDPKEIMIYKLENIKKKLIEGLIDEHFLNILLSSFIKKKQNLIKKSISKTN